MMKLLFMYGFCSRSRTNPGALTCDQTYGSLVPDSARYTPPELARSGWDAIKKSPHSVVDSYEFGVLIFEVFNGSFLGPDQAGQTKGIPPSMQSSYKRLVNANPKARLSVGHFLEQGRRHGAFFDTPLIKLTEGVDNLGVKSETEREEFLESVLTYGPYPGTTSLTYFQ